MGTLVIDSVDWYVWFYACTGRKYKLTMRRFRTYEQGETPAVPIHLTPVAFLEDANGDQIRALLMNGGERSFGDLESASKFYDSQIVDMCSDPTEVQ
jgi:hypothetical protein